MCGLQGVENLFDRVDRLASFEPTFCDITWGAGGTTADLTLNIASRLQNMVLSAPAIASTPKLHHECCVPFSLSQFSLARGSLKNLLERLIAGAS